MPRFSLRGQSPASSQLQGPPFLGFFSYCNDTDVLLPALLPVWGSYQLLTSRFPRCNPVPFLLRSWSPAPFPCHLFFLLCPPSSPFPCFRSLKTPDCRFLAFHLLLCRKSSTFSSFLGSPSPFLMFSLPFSFLTCLLRLTDHHYSSPQPFQLSVFCFPMTFSFLIFLHLAPLSPHHMGLIFHLHPLRNLLFSLSLFITQFFFFQPPSPYYFFLPATSFPSPGAPLLLPFF